MVLVRQEIGDVLRDFRLQKAMTLRQVASRASVALGYLSEVERGQKEASSEILASVADALDTPISVIMREVGDRLAVVEGSARARSDGSPVPDTLPDELVAEFDADLVRASRRRDRAGASRTIARFAATVDGAAQRVPAAPSPTSSVAFGRVLTRDMVLGELGDRTAERRSRRGAAPARSGSRSARAGGAARALARRRHAASRAS